MKAGTVDQVLRECKRLGVRNILALRGDEPRESEYALDDTSSDEPQHGENRRFAHAVDLIRYIRETHGEYFCIAAAAYPEGHPTPSPAHPGGIYQNPERDIPHLIEKVEAGADFLLTQLFYDVDKYLTFEKMLRNHESKVFEKIPIVPGMMPAQGWQSFSRTIKLARVTLPQNLRKKLEALKGDDEGIKDAGVEVITDMIETIKQNRPQRQTAQGFHFYTLNLEKAIAQILEGADLLKSASSLDIPMREDGKSLPASASHLSPDAGGLDSKTTTANKRRTSSTKNRVVVSNLAAQAQNSDDYVIDDEAGKPDTNEDQPGALEGEGSLGRAGTWDDFPNGRWGDARSPGTSKSLPGTPAHLLAEHLLLEPRSAQSSRPHSRLSYREQMMTPEPE